MVIEKRIRLRKIDYFICFEVKYNKYKMLSRKYGKYFDMGDVSLLIEEFEKSYEFKEEYDKDVSFMNDVIYIYERFPFLSYIKDTYYDKKGYAYSTGIIYKKEIDKYIKKHKIKTGLFNGKESVCPLLFK